MSLDRAIAALQQELLDLGVGQKKQPAEGSTDWYLLRGKAVGLSALRAMRAAAGTDDPAIAERFYKRFAADVKDPNAGTAG